MKLFAAPAACSLTCHIAFREAGLPFEIELNNWERVRELNPQGAVPVLQLEDGSVVTQNVAIVNYLAALAPQSSVLPSHGSREWVEALRWLSWVSSDPHPVLGRMFKVRDDEAQRSALAPAAERLLEVAEKHLSARPYLTGERFSAADAYLFTVFGWSPILKLDTAPYPALRAHAARVAERPAVRAAMEREGLLG
ncbi:MAG TPA: glutathione binding-like protein [Telluria sp.]|nr:glutathione binding-like protein [Telluria sp.]